MPVDETLADGIGLLEKGGPVMFVILGLSVLGLAIVLVKIFHFARARAGREGFADRALEALARQDFVAALDALGERNHPVARVMRVAIETARAPGLAEKEREAEIVRVGSNELRELESFLRGLEIVASLSPLLGLLGTVFGMIEAFAELERAGAQVNAALLAGGIWEALLTTAFGLTVGIPALAAFHLFEGQVERIQAAMRDAVARVDAACWKQRRGSSPP